MQSRFPRWFIHVKHIRDGTPNALFYIDKGMPVDAATLDDVVARYGLSRRPRARSMPPSMRR
jgi:hypothetical protein